MLHIYNNTSGFIRSSTKACSIIVARLCFLSERLDQPTQEEGARGSKLERRARETLDPTSSWKRRVEHSAAGGRAINLAMKCPSMCVRCAARGPPLASIGISYGRQRRVRVRHQDRYSLHRILRACSALLSETERAAYHMALNNNIITCLP